MPTLGEFIGKNIRHEPSRSYVRDYFKCVKNGKPNLDDEVTRDLLEQVEAILTKHFIDANEAIAKLCPEVGVIRNNVIALRDRIQSELQS